MNTATQTTGFIETRQTRPPRQ